jgi:cyclophilin family peptidyl-prolyl cis-trans isomerase
MKPLISLCLTVLVAVTTLSGQTRGQGSGGAAKPSAAGNPVILFETVKGNFEMETYPKDAPKSVEHILALVKRNFYNGLRVHRQVPGFVVQFGDPQTRDMTKLASWGNRGSGKAIGVAEIKRPHKLGAVALAHIEGDLGGGDSQMYICLNGPDRYSEINRNFTVFAQVISGMDVVQKLREKDVIRRATIR